VAEAGLPEGFQFHALRHIGKTLADWRVWQTIYRRSGSEIRGHGARYLEAVVDQRYRGPSVERAAGMADSE
jgi:hypothetical protein